jgi:hypothetical protein
MSECAGCTFCCTILAVPELKKPPWTPCVHCTGTGCSIHDAPAMPSACKDFECGYLTSGLPERFRPDRCHIMITGEEEALQAHFLHVDPAYPFAPKTPIGQQLIQAVILGGKYPNIVLITGDKEQIVTRDPASALILKQKLREMKRETRRLERLEKQHK